MTSNSLAQTVESFADLTHSLADADLDRAWAWGDYDSEGVRFAFFRVYEELRTLAVKLVEERASSGHFASSTHRILASYHTAYRDLQAALLGVPAEWLNLPPGEDQWSVRKTLSHIVAADAGFFAVISHSVSQLRTGVATPTRLTQEAYDAILGIDEATEEAILQGPLANLQAFHGELHGRVLRELADIGEHEIDQPSIYWESAPMSLRFRLHRFDSHMRQHTVQIDKTLADLRQQPSEARRLLRLIYAALAEAEGAVIGADTPGAAMQQATADEIGALTAKISPVLV